MNDLLDFLQQYKTNNKTKKIFFSLSGTYSPWQIFHVIVLTKSLNKKGYGIDYFIGGSQNVMERLINFNSNKIFKIKKINNIIKYFFKIVFYNIKLLPSFFSIQKAFDIEIDGVYIGDYIYDEFIRTTNKPTVSNVTIRYILSINKALLFYFYYKGIFSSSKYEYVFTSHYCYIRYGMIARIASKYGIKPIYYESFCDNGGFKLVKLYLKDDLNKVVNRINTTFVNSYSKDLMILKKSKKYFNGVMKGDVELLSDFHNFNNSRVSSNSTKRSDITKLRGDSKIIVISAHCLVDNITGINGRQTVYRDFYTWLIETLKQCDKNTNITTFLKIHPMEKEYTYKPKVIDVFKSVPLKNVFLWPDDLDLKENNDLIDVVLTVAGSVAIEFPCFGVPVIAASINTIPTSSYYEGIVEVRDKGEYIDIIKKIHTIEKIDQNNKDISMLNYYFFYGSMWYFIDKKYYPTADDTIQSEYLKDRSFNYTNPTPVRRDSFSVIKNKLKLFDAEYGKKYESDLDEFFSNKDIRKLSEVRFFREQSFELKE